MSDDATHSPKDTFTFSFIGGPSPPGEPLQLYFNGTRDELIAAFRESVAEIYGADRVEEIMQMQDWYTPE